MRDKSVSLVKGIAIALVVMKDVPSNFTVIGNPAIIIRKNGERVSIPL